MTIRAYINEKDELEYDVNDKKISPLDLATFFMFATKEQVIEKFGDTKPDVIISDQGDKRLDKAKAQVEKGLEFIYNKINNGKD